MLLRPISALVMLLLATAAAPAADGLPTPGIGVTSLGGLRGAISATQGRAALGAAYCAASCARTADWVAALEAVVPGATADLLTNIPDLPSGPIWRAWSAPFVEPGNALATFVQARYGLTAAQVAALFTASQH